MQLLAPLAFIALVPLAGAIILLYLLKLRRRDFTVPSVFLWRRAVQDVQANAPFQKLRANLLLILQLLALAAVVAGLAAPFFLAKRLGGRTTLILLDASASMRATDVGGTRFEEAKRLAADIVNKMGRRDEAALLICSGHAELALSFTQDRGRLLSAIGAAQPTDCVTDVRDGLLLAYSLAAKRPDSHIYLISDGAFPAMPAVNSPAEVRFLKVGRRNDNVAILAFEAARTPDSNEHQVFLRLHNYASEPKHAVLTISHEDDPFYASELDLAPDESRTETYRLAVEQPGLLKAQIDVADDLAADNVCYTFAEAPSARSVLLVTPGNLFLEQALLVQPGIEVFRAAKLSAAEAEAAYRDYDVVIFDRVTPPAAPKSGAVLLVDTGLEGVVALGPEIASPAISNWEDQHPALRFVSFDAVQIAKARRLSPGPGALVLARAGEAPVIIGKEAPGVRVLAFGWDLLDSDLPLRVGFPVLLSNTLQWLSETSGRAPAVRVQPGAILQYPTPPGSEQGRLTTPDGRSRSLPAVDGKLICADSTRVGAYSLKSGDRTWRWAVDLRSDAESNLAPADSLKLGERQVQAGEGPPRTEQHLWPFLVALALAVLLGEWHLYHRRY